MANNQITYVSELDASKDFVNMKVRIIRRWINPIGKLDMVLIDEKGSKIQATVKKELVESFDQHIKEDATVLIKRFGVGVFDDPFPVVKHALKLNFYKCTEVCPDVGFGGHLYGFAFLPFNQITAEKSKDKSILNVDVIGCVTHCGNLSIFNSFKGETKRFNFEMKDLDGRIVKGTLWNDYAVQFNHFVENNKSGEHIIVIMQHAVIKEWRNDVTIQSDKFGTRVYINEDIKEAHDFRRRLIVKEGATGNSQNTFSTQTVYPNRLEFLQDTLRKHLDEVREAETEMECTVSATIALLEPEFGWFYIACRNCNKKVLTKMEYLEVAEEHELTESLISAPVDSIWCRKEKAIATEVVPRFRVTFRVQDSTDSASFTMWDRDVSRLIGLTATDIREKEVAKTEPEVYLHELDGMLNKKLAFKIKIDRYNLKHKGSAYTVIKMTDDPQILSELDNQENVNQVHEDHALAEVSTVKLDESSQGGIDSKDAYSVTGDSVTATVEKDTGTSPVLKRPADTPGAESSTKATRKMRKMKVP